MQITPRWQDNMVSMLFDGDVIQSLQHRVFARIREASLLVNMSPGIVGTHSCSLVHKSNETKPVSSGDCFRKTSTTTPIRTRVWAAEKQPEPVLQAATRKGNDGLDESTAGHLTVENLLLQHAEAPEHRKICQWVPATRYASIATPHDGRGYCGGRHSTEPQFRKASITSYSLSSRALQQSSSGMDNETRLCKVQGSYGSAINEPSSEISEPSGHAVVAAHRLDSIAPAKKTMQQNVGHVIPWVAARETQAVPHPAEHLPGTTMKKPRPAASGDVCTLDETSLSVSLLVSNCQRGDVEQLGVDHFPSEKVSEEFQCGQTAVAANDDSSAEDERLGTRTMCISLSDEELWTLDAAREEAEDDEKKQRQSNDLPELLYCDAETASDKEVMHAFPAPLPTVYAGFDARTSTHKSSHSQRGANTADRTMAEDPASEVLLKRSLTCSAAETIAKQGSSSLSANAELVLTFGNRFHHISFGEKSTSLITRCSSFTI